MTREYKVVERYSQSDLESQVNKLIEDGWAPFGGVSFGAYIPDRRGHARVQAMIKETKELREDE